MKAFGFSPHAIPVLAVLCGSFFVVDTEKAPKDFIVAAYVPEYRFGLDFAAAGAVATDLILFSVEPSIDGEIRHLDRIPKDRLAAAQKAKEATGVRLLLCVGGGGRSEFFIGMAAKSATRKTFAQNVVDTCKKMGLDGFDFDWEENFTGNEKAALAYGKLLKETAKAAKPENLTVSMAYHPGQEAAISSKDFTKSVDRFHIMSYDHCTSIPCKHSSLESAEAHVQAAIRHLPPHKLVLGLPAYGRSMDKPQDVATYADLVKDAPPSLDTQDDVREGKFFNGPHTARQKAVLAERYGLAGVFVWEAGQDLPGDREHSLLRALAQEGRRIRGARRAKRAAAAAPDSEASEKEEL